jgi:hypothetical protein
MMWVIFDPFKKIARFETCLNIPNELFQNIWNELFYKKDEQEKILYMSKTSYF